MLQSLAFLVLLVSSISAQQPAPARAPRPPPGVVRPPSQPASPPPSPAPPPSFFIDVQVVDAAGRPNITYSASVLISATSQLLQRNGINIGSTPPTVALLDKTLAVETSMASVGDLAKASSLLASVDGARAYIKLAGLPPCQTSLFATNASLDNTITPVYGCSILGSVDTTTRNCTCPIRCFSEKAAGKYELARGIPKMYASRALPYGVLVPFLKPSIAWCAQQARANNSRYYSLQYGIECWYGSSDLAKITSNRPQQSRPTACILPCVWGGGNCGGFWAFSLHALY